MCTLVVFAALDYITGIIKAIFTKTLSSQVGLKGIIKEAVHIHIGWRGSHNEQSRPASAGTRGLNRQVARPQTPSARIVHVVSVE
ncbi:MAG: phage holin family protein [Clostridiales bacterium]|jgi:hypothetical protein|nr:phage holin family protein [Clostridiales bacterium]